MSVEIRRTIDWTQTTFVEVASLLRPQLIFMRHWLLFATLGLAEGLLKI